MIPEEDQEGSHTHEEVQTDNSVGGGPLVEVLTVVTGCGFPTVSCQGRNDGTRVYCGVFIFPQVYFEIFGFD